MVVEGASTATAMPPVERMVIVGTGLMGTGIAQVAVEAGLHVTIVGRTDEKCEQARAKVATGVTKTAKRRFAAETADTQAAFIASVLGKLSFVTLTAQDARGSVSTDTTEVIGVCPGGGYDC